MTNHSKVLVILAVGLVYTFGLAGRAAADNSVNPSSFTFVSYVGGPNPAAQTLNIVPFLTGNAWTATTDGSAWLSLSSTSGSGNGTTIISATTGSLAAGLYTATITVAFAGNPVNFFLPVSFQVAPSQVSFSANVGGSNPPSQTLQLSVASSGSIAGSWTATVATTDGANWLVAPATGSASTLSASVNIANLAVGTYTGTITLRGATFGTSGTTIQPVVLTIMTPAVTLAPTSLTLTGNAGSTTPLSQTVTVTAASGWSGSVATTSGGSWLSISPASGTSSGTFSVNVDLSKLTASTTPYAGTVTVTPLANGLAVTLNVSVTVSAPAVVVAPTSLTFNGTFAGAQPTGQTVTVTAASGWSGSVTTTTGGSWLSITPTSATTSGSFMVNVDISKLSATTAYKGTITVSPAGTGTPVTISVTANVAGPTISAVPSTLNFTQVEGQVALAQSVMLAATPAVSNWSASASVSGTTTQWLSVSPSGGGFPQSASVGPNALAANLTAAGSPYTGTVTFTDSNASPTTLTVQVMLTVTAAPAPQLTVSQTSVTVPGTQATGASPIAIFIGNSGSGSLAWTSTVSVANTTAGNWLTATPSGSATLHAPSEMVLTFASNLQPNVYTGTITVTAGTQKQTINVTYVVAPSAPQLLLGSTSLRFNMIAGGPLPAAETVELANSGAAAMVYSVSVISGNIVAAPSSASTSVAAGSASSFSVSIAPNSPSVSQTGTYYGLLRVVYAAASTPTARLGSADVSVVLVVSAATAPPTVTAYPSGLILTPLQLSQTVTLSTSASSAVSLTLSSTTQSGGPWLTATSAASLNPSATATVSGVTTSLPSTPGVYKGAVTAIFGSGIASQDINVYLIVPHTSGAGVESLRSAPAASCTPSQLIMVLRQLAANFSATVALPQNIEAQLVDDCGNPATSANVTAAFSTGDATVVLSNVGGGIYAATWNPVNANPVVVTITAVQSTLPPVTATVAGTVAANPAPPAALTTAGVVNGASFAQNGVVSPGEIISVFGLNLPPANTPNSGFPLPVTLDGIKLSMGGIDMPLFFIGSGQVNAQVPAELSANAQTSLVARAFNGTTEVSDSVPVAVSVSANTPGIFLAAAGSLQGAILNNPSLQLVNAANPATAGDVLTIYCTGLGATTPAVATGAAAPATVPLATVNSTVTVTFGTAAPVAVQFQGLTPNFVGLYQVNVQVPAGLTPGAAVPVVLNQNGVSSNMVTIGIK